MFRQFLIVSVLILASIVILTDSQSIYKYEIIVDHIEKPKRDALLDYGTIRVKKINRSTYVVDGYIDLLQPLTDEFTGKAHIYAQHGNEYRKIFERPLRNLCTYLKDDKMVVSQIINTTSAAPEIKDCPILPQRIYFYNTQMPTDRLTFEPIFTKGKLRITVELHDTLITDFSIYFILTKQWAFP